MQFAILPQELMGHAAAQPIFPNPHPCSSASSSSSKRKHHSLQLWPAAEGFAGSAGVPRRLEHLSSPCGTLSSSQPQPPLRENETKVPRDVIALTAGFTLSLSGPGHFSQLIALLFVQPCFSLPPASPVMYRHFIAHSLDFTTGFFTLWPTSPMNSFVTFPLSCSGIKITRIATFSELVSLLRGTCREQGGNHTE